MVYGLFFPNLHLILEKFLENLPVCDFTWKIEEVEIWERGQNVPTPRFVSPVMPGHELWSDIVKQPEFNFLFGVFKAFPNKSSVHNIDSFSDYLASECQLVLLIYDETEVEIYTKDSQMLKQIVANVALYFDAEYEYITEENQIRIRMSVQ